jgi:hypothetical protein
MATTITYNSTTITPKLVLGWETSQDTSNVIHEILGKTSPDVTLRGAKMRTGTLTTLWETATAADTCRTLHSNAGVFTLASTEVSQASMHYVVAGVVTTTLDTESVSVWTVSIDFQEVTV